MCRTGDYDIDSDLIVGFPLTSNGTTWKIIPGQEHNEFAREKINISVNELKQERDVVRDLLPG